MRLLTREELEGGLRGAPNWVVDGKSLTQTRTFANFVEAMGFVNGAAKIAEEMGHHPDIDIRYSKVRIGLTTHDAGGITNLDLILAKRLNEI